MPAGWSPADMPDQHGRTALVTGANSGIGFHVAAELAGRGAHVLLASRDADRGRAARAAMVRELPTASIELVGLDLADLDSVARLAGQVLDRLSPQGGLRQGGPRSAAREPPLAGLRGAHRGDLPQRLGTRRTMTSTIPHPRGASRGQPVCAGRTIWAARALVRAASSTAAVATASHGSTGTGPMPRTAAANAG